jgi:chromate transporter
MEPGADGPVQPAPVTTWELCKTCLYLGLTCYGGPAMVGYVREVMVVRRRWVRQDEFAEGLALSQVVPGATLTQVISYVALVLKGPAGAALAATAFILPGALIVMAVSALYFRWQTLPLVASLSRGVGAVVIGLLAYASVRLAKASFASPVSYGIAGASCLAYLLGANAFVVAVGAAGLARLLIGSPENGDPADAARATPSSVRPGTWAALALAGALALAATWLAVPVLGRLCVAFAAIGSVAFGGGYSMVPLIQQQVVDKLGLLSIRSFLDGIALGQITPGPIMLTATFVGYAASGPIGALAATAAIFAPSWFIVVAVAPTFRSWTRRTGVQAMIQGVVASFVGMLISVLIQYGRVSLTDIPSALAAAAAFAALWWGAALPLVVAAGLLLSPFVFR